MRPSFALKSLLCLLVGTVILTSSAGCLSLAANLIHAIKGNKRPAEFNALKGKKVAIVCGTDDGLSSNATSTLLTRYVQALLEENIKDIKVVRQDQIDRWIDSHEWKATDYEEIGKGVNAEYVLAINVMNLSLRDGMTLYRGKCDISVAVYDIKDNGRVVFRKQMPEFEFPKIGGPTVTDTSEAKFRGLFLTVVSRKIATLFYEAEATEDYALDAISNSF
jgi:hypothetical protein